MQSLEAACEEAEKIIEKVKFYSLPLAGPQDYQSVTTNNSDSSTTKHSFSIFDKLKDLQREECAKDLQHANNNCLKSDSFLLEKLVKRHRLNTLIVNLYPERNEYSIALRMGSIVDDNSIGNNIDKTSSNTLNEVNMVTLQWQSDEELLRCIDNEELPNILIDLLEYEYPELFYSGCIIAELRDYQQLSCETHHVLLKPTTHSLLSDLNSIMTYTTGHEWTEQEQMLLESRLINATSSPLCLDPRPTVGLIKNKIQAERNLFNTLDLRKCAQRFALIPQKRKLISKTMSSNGLELYDFIVEKRLKSTEDAAEKDSPAKQIPLKMMLPSLETKKFLDLIPEKEVDTSKFRFYKSPRETRNSMPHFIEQYSLTTEQKCERKPNQTYTLVMKLLIFQRPFNSEFLCELYINYKEGCENGAPLQFTFGSRSYVNKFIYHFIDLLKKNATKSFTMCFKLSGQKPMDIPCNVDGDSTAENTLSGQTQQQQQQQQQQSTVQSMQRIQQQQVHLVNTVPSALTNGTAVPNVVFVQNAQTPQHNSETAVPILQAQLQANNQFKLDKRTTNPEITALVASLNSIAQKFEQEAAAKSPSVAATSGNNTAILSLLNTSPVNNINSATSAAVANAITNSISPVECALNQKLLARKMTLTNAPRVLNQCGNVITVNNNSVQTQQVRISALASQLAAPPVNVIMATSAQAQSINFTQQPHTRLMPALRSKAVTNCDSSSSGSSTSLSALLVNTPSADHPIPGVTNTTSTLLERLNATPDNKTNPAVISSAPTTGQQTMNLHTLNLTHLNSIPGVQVQIPRLSNVGVGAAAAPPATSLIFSVAVTAPVTVTSTCTSSGMQHLSNSSNASTVVITNNTRTGSTSPVLPLPFAHLVAASGVKGLTQQGLRVTTNSPSQTVLAGSQPVTKSVQLIGALPRNAQIKQQPFTTARGILPATQRLTNTALKMNVSNATTAQVGNATGSNTVVTLSAQQQQQLQLTFQKQAQYQQYQHLTQQLLNVQSQPHQSQPQQQQSKTSVLSPAAIASKHHRRSNAADSNK